ncbi:MAG: DNA recombination protein RmuC [Oscillospiraceae bacterium]
MQLAEILMIAASVIMAICVIALFVAMSKLSSGRKQNDEVLQRIGKDTLSEQRESRRDTVNLIKSMSDTLMLSQNNAFGRQDAAMTKLSSSVDERLRSVDIRLQSFTVQSEQKLDNMRTTMEARLSSIQDDNNKRLEEMRATVDEKLQKTLEDKIGNSFKIVSERLEQVYKGLGEMQTLAAGVGDLKKVLSNVKTRGIFGEIQLGAILEQMMSKDQYEENVVTKHGSRDPVEFAVKLPNEDSGNVYLPIDAKFPMDAYSALVDAYDQADASIVEAAAKQLEQRIKSEAKDIRDKYIDPPYTTDFAIMFLPVEGMYAEVVRRGLIEKLQRDYKVVIAGPTTMSALLNSLQMGFKTLAIQKRSGEVWEVLGAVKTEFDTFAQVLATARQRLTMANDDLEKLVGVRTRQIQKKLKEVSTLSGESLIGPISESKDV